MKLCQGQVWDRGGEYIRIVRLERLEVEYKSLASLASREGTRHVTSKKAFCRLLKHALLVAPAEPPNAPTGGLTAGPESNKVGQHESAP